MKKLTSLLVSACCLVLAGCAGRDAEVKAFLDERAAVFGQMMEKIDANPTEAGVEEARKLFEAKKDDLRAKRDALKNGKISFDLTQKLLAADVSEHKIFDALYRDKIVGLYKPPVESKYYKLFDDYRAAAQR
jgi:multidrug efflux pump subunit AcrA (membrane-fusion protein)